MPAEPAVLARNTSYLTLALVAQKVISFLYFTFLARTLGPVGIGRYVVALSLTTIFSVLMDLGLATVLTRETARDTSTAEAYTRLVLGFKLVVTLFVSGTVVATVHLLGYPLLVRELAYVACGVMVFDSFTLTAYSTIRGFQTLTWESIGSVLMQVVVAGAGLLVSLATHDPRAFMAALLVGSFAHTTYAILQLRFRFHVHLMPRWNSKALAGLAALAWPFALAAILTRVYGYVDTIMLSRLTGDFAVGIYSVAYKVTFAFQFIPSAFSASLLPGFSSYFQDDKQKLADTFTRGFVYLTAISLPLSLGAIAIAPHVIHALYPAFEASVLPLQVLMASLPFLFATFPIGALLPACNRQARHTANLGIATAVSVALNIFLIPRLGPLGAAVTSLASTMILFILGWVVAKNLVAYDRSFLYSRLTRIVAAAAVMAGVAWWLSIYVSVLVAAVLSGGVYVVALLGLRGVTMDEIRSLMNAMSGRVRVVAQ